MTIDNILPNRYAQALFSIALDQKCLDIIENDFAKLEQLIIDESKTLLNIVLPYNLLNKLWLKVGDIFKLNPLTINFILLLAKNKRINALQQIIQKYQKIILEHNSIKTVYITSATEIDYKDITKNLEKLLNTKIVIKHDIKPALLGGFKLMFDSQMLDCTIRSKLDALKTQMQNVRIK